MIYLLYFDKLDAGKRNASITAMGVFLCAESLLLLLLLPYSRLPYFLALAGILSLYLAWRNYPRLKEAPWNLMLFSDIGMYVAAFLATVLILRLNSRQIPPPGIVLPRLDVELFCLAVITVTLAILPPAINDPYCERVLPPEEKFRRVQFLKFVPFGFRRSLTGTGVFPLLATVTFPFLLTSSHPLASIAILIGWGFLAMALFQVSYGYRSYIMVVYCPTLFITAAFAYVLRTPYAPFIPHGLINGLAKAWGMLWLVAFGIMWRLQEKQNLIFEQKIWHSVFLGILGAGHLAIYGCWILPIVK